MERIHNQRGWISLLSISAIAFTLDICGYGGTVVTSGTSSDSDCRIIFFWAGGYRRGYPFIL